MTHPTSTRIIRAGRLVGILMNIIERLVTKGEGGIGDGEWTNIKIFMTLSNFESPSTRLQRGRLYQPAGTLPTLTHHSPQLVYICIPSEATLQRYLGDIQRAENPETTVNQRCHWFSHQLWVLVCLDTTPNESYWWLVPSIARFQAQATPIRSCLVSLLMTSSTSASQVCVSQHLSLRSLTNEPLDR